MTTKIVSILLALLTLISGTAAASFDPEADLQTQHGYILEMLDDGSFLLLNQDNQTVQVNTDEKHRDRSGRAASRRSVRDGGL